MLIYLSKLYEKAKRHYKVIQVMDLYFSADRENIDDKNSKVQKLNRVLKHLPLFPDRPDGVKLRNADGVSLELSNFLAINFFKSSN